MMKKLVFPSHIVAALLDKTLTNNIHWMALCVADLLGYIPINVIRLGFRVEKA
jgi:hypothetical protein